MRRAAALLALAALAACGKQQPLRPAAGGALPVKPALAPVQLNADQLLAAQPRYRPGRTDELLVKSQTRPDDRFDLPPQ